MYIHIYLFIYIYIQSDTDRDRDKQSHTKTGITLTDKWMHDKHEWQMVRQFVWWVTARYIICTNLVIYLAHFWRVIIIRGAIWSIRDCQGADVSHRLYSIHYAVGLDIDRLTENRTILVLNVNFFSSPKLRHCRSLVTPALSLNRAGGQCYI